MPASIQDILSLPVGGRIDPLAKFARSLATGELNGAGSDAGVVSATVNALVALIEDGAGSGKQRVALGEALGLLDDPRLRTPDDADYWAEVQLDDESPVLVGRFMVTTAEWRAFLANGYRDDANWSDEGRAWRDSVDQSWEQLADAAESDLVVPNQPVVGVTWYEAMAYANAHNARLLTHGERKWVVRGPEKRPYPWGAPFRAGYANSREEALGRPTAVGIYRQDRTPEGIWDLAANVGEWAANRRGAECGYHPGSWKQDSLASWAKAFEFAPAAHRFDDLGFRLARDPKAS